MKNPDGVCKYLHFLTDFVRFILIPTTTPCTFYYYSPIYNYCKNCFSLHSTVNYVNLVADEWDNEDEMMGNEGGDKMKAKTKGR